MRTHRTVVLAVALLVAAIAGVGAADATPVPCSFTVTGKVMKLDADCSTSTTILIPAGFTFDGQGHTITALDPPGGAFLAPILKNAGPVAHVRNVTLTAWNLTDMCEPLDDKLRAILFESASGSITNTTILNVNKSGSGRCAGQGANIFLRNANPDGPPAKVTVRDNEVRGFSGLGASVVGNVRATISYNTFEGLGGTGISISGQFGVAVQRGALATVSQNTIIQHWSEGLPSASGITVFEADQAQVTGNTITGASRGIVLDALCFLLPSTSRNLIAGNQVGAAEIGILLSATSQIVVSGCPAHVDNNMVRGNGVMAPAGEPGLAGIALLVQPGLFTPVMNGNIVKGNTIEGYDTPILQSGDTNTIIQNNTIVP